MRFGSVITALPESPGLSRKDASREVSQSYVPSRTKPPDRQMRKWAWLLHLPVTQRGIAFCTAKTEGCPTWLPANDARRARFFCPGMSLLPADDAKGHAFALHRMVASKPDSISSRAPSLARGARFFSGLERSPLRQPALWPLRPLWFPQPLWPLQPTVYGEVPCL